MGVRGRGRVLIWLRVGETRAGPLDTRTGPAAMPVRSRRPIPVWPGLPRGHCSRASAFMCAFLHRSPSCSFLQRLLSFSQIRQHEGHCPRSLSSGHNGPGQLCAFSVQNLVFRFCLPHLQTRSPGRTQPHACFPWSARHLLLCMAHGRPPAQSINK